MNNNAKVFRLVILAEIILIFSIAFSHWASLYTSYTDFPVFYNSAIYHSNHIGGISDIYDRWISLEYNLPEKTNPGKFIYSPAALIALSPLGHMEYFTAKTVLMSLDMLSYVLSVYLILARLKYRGWWFGCTLFLSILWPPFIADWMFGQINSILLLIIMMAICSEKRGRPMICGSLIGIAAWFKFFPIGIAMLLGIKNWRILASCAFVFIFTLLPGDALKWFSAMKTIEPTSISPALRIFEISNQYYFFIYSALIALATAAITLKIRSLDSLKIAAYAIPAIFLAAPAFEFYHLTLLIVSYLFFLKIAKDKLGLVFLCALILVPLMLCAGFMRGRVGGDGQIFYYFSVFLIWFSYSYMFLLERSKEKTESMRQKFFFGGDDRKSVLQEARKDK
jgi:Glycosyltransferase family 87